MAGWKKVIVSGSAADLAQVTASVGAKFASVDIDGGSITGITDLAVADGGTGASTFTAGGILLGNGTSAISDTGVLGDGVMLVGDADGAPSLESGDTLRSSIGVGSGDSPQFTGIEIGNASDTTLTRSSAGNLSVEGNLIYRAGGTDVPLADGGTGASTAAGARTNLGLGTGDNVVHAQVSASFSGSFQGDGSNLTGISFQIEDLNNTLTNSTIADADLLVAADDDASNEEKKITFAHVKSAVVDSISGDVNVDSAGASVIQADSVHGTMLNTDVADGSSIELSSDSLSVKALGVTNAMLAGSIANAKLANSTISGVALGGNLNSLSAAANGGISLTSYNGSAAVANLQLDIDGMTDIGADLASGDLLIVDDGAGGTNRKTEIDRIATLFAGDGLTASSAVLAVNVDDSSIETSGDALRVKALGVTNAMLAGSIANGKLANSAITIAGNSTSLGGSITADTIIAGVSNNAISGDKINGGTIDATTITALTAGSARITGDLTVEGNTVNAQVSNLNVEDRFILLNSGSAAGDAGIIAQTETAFSGSAFAYDDSESRWGFQQGTKLGANAVELAPDAHAAAVVTSDLAAYQKNGNIRVQGGEIFIYTE